MSSEDPESGLDRREPGASAKPSPPDADAIAAYHELQAETLTRGDAAFVHQHVVDAWTAQHADANTKTIGLAFALFGLYLHVERGFTGREVQRAHMALAARRKDWPRFPLPSDRGATTVHDVFRAETGPARDRAIDAWCGSVWSAYSSLHRDVIHLLEAHGIV